MRRSGFVLWVLLGAACVACRSAPDPDPGRAALAQCSREAQELKLEGEARRNHVKWCLAEHAARPDAGGGPAR